MTLRVLNEGLRLITKDLRLHSEQWVRKPQASTMVNKMSLTNDCSPDSTLLHSVSKENPLPST